MQQHDLCNHNRTGRCCEKTAFGLRHIAAVAAAQNNRRLFRYRWNSTDNTVHSQADHSTDRQRIAADHIVDHLICLFDCERIRVTQDLSLGFC